MKNWQFGIICLINILGFFIVLRQLQTRGLSRVDIYQLEQRVQSIDTNVRILNNNVKIVNDNIGNIDRKQNNNALLKLLF